MWIHYLELVCEQKYLRSQTLRIFLITFKGDIFGVFCTVVLGGLTVPLSMHTDMSTGFCN